MMELLESGLGTDVVDGTRRRANLTLVAQRYLDRVGAGVEDLFHHVLAMLHDPAYREANAGALRMEWPRILLLVWPNGDADGAGDGLAASAAPRTGVGRAAGLGHARPRRHHRRVAP